MPRGTGWGTHTHTLPRLGIPAEGAVERGLFGLDGGHPGGVFYNVQEWHLCTCADRACLPHLAPSPFHPCLP
jgi:hypothetical protein